MKQVIIVGAGGLALEVADQLLGDYANNRDWIVYGFLDSRPQTIDRVSALVDIRHLGDPNNYHVNTYIERFAIGISSPQHKRKYVDVMKAKGATFIDIRTNVTFGYGARFDEGCVFAVNTSLSVGVVMGSFVYLGKNTQIGHESTIGSFCHIGANCFIAGNVTIESDVTIHPCSLIGQGLTIGTGAIIGAGSVVMRDVPAYSTCLGNPARIVKK
jgi:sugar O-acyltransferase (sialic acid O-acetyltransferase NeuD family)